MSTTNKISANLKRLMYDSGHNQVSLAKATGVKQSTIQRILAGIIKEPKLQQLVPLCDVYCITIDEFIGRKETIDSEAAKLVALFNTLPNEDRHIYMLALEAKAAISNHRKNSAQRSLKTSAPTKAI